MFKNGKKVSLLLVGAALLCLCTVLMAGCSASSEGGIAGGDYSGVAPGNGEWKSEEELPPIAEDEERGGEELSGSLRYVIREGSLTLTVEDTRETVEEIERMTAESGGLVSESRIYESREGYYTAEMVLRVPENEFDRFISRLQKLGEALNIHKSSEDVTLPYLDLETRIKNLEAEEARLREILAQAKTVDDILQVERELSRVRGEIELKKMNFTRLQDQVALSTIHLLVREGAIRSQAISQKPFENMGQRMKEALFRSINFIASAIAFILVALTALLPVLVIIALLVLLILLLARARRRKKENIPPGGQTPAM
ncbi:DUF4349 domain-containing protein [Candidatus Darwinibacter acetoxidans]